MNGSLVFFQEILRDLSEPELALGRDISSRSRRYRYKIYSLIRPSNIDMFGVPLNSAKDFIIEAENYGVPQARHRVILVGVRDDIGVAPGQLQPTQPVAGSQALEGLPRLRSGLSQAEDSDELWIRALRRASSESWFGDLENNVRNEMVKTLTTLRVPIHRRGGEFVKQKRVSAAYRPDWYLDRRIGGFCNSATRQHIEADLHRYLFAACFARANGYSPRLSDFPEALRPKHTNVPKAMSHDNFSDRFRVQVKGLTATTVMSHISKDGHYYIHHDPSQCRSLTVREAARLQTFPDNYYFCGSRTEQYTQVGNAVPPLLARQIAQIVYDVLQAAQRVEDGRYAYTSTS